MRIEPKRDRVMAFGVLLGWNNGSENRSMRVAARSTGPDPFGSGAPVRARIWEAQYHRITEHSSGLSARYTHTNKLNRQT